MRKLNKSTALVTVDGGKDAHYAYITSDTGQTIKPFRVSNDRHGFEILDKKINTYLEKNNISGFSFGYESTGTYLSPLVHHMDALGAKLIQINPKHTKRVKEVIDNSPSKTDQKDPVVIASIIRLGSGLNALLAKGKYADLRHLVQSRERIIEDKTRCINRIEGLTAQYFPEYTKVMKSMGLITSQHILKTYPTQEKLLELGEAKLTIVLLKKSRGQLGLERAKELIEAAKYSIGCIEGRALAGTRVGYLIEQIEMHNKQLKEVEQRMITITISIPYSKYIESIPGIGWITTAYLLSEITGIANFNRSSQIEKLAGLNLFELSSGKQRGNRHISKRGRGLLRKILFLATLRMIKKGGIFRTYFDNTQEKGKPKLVSITALSRKLIRLIFALATNEEIFDTDYIVKQIKTQVEI